MDISTEIILDFLSRVSCWFNDSLKDLMFSLPQSAARYASRAPLTRVAPPHLPLPNCRQLEGLKYDVAVHCGTL